MGFLADADSILEQVEGQLLSIEDGADPIEVINTVFGMVHTIKGASGFFEPKTLHQFAHFYEDQYKQIQAGKVGITEGRLSALLEGIDVLKKLVEEFKTDRFSEVTIESLVARLNIDEGSPQAQSSSDAKASPGQAQDSSPSGFRKNDQQPAREIKVELSVLDEFLHASGEMTVIRNMITKAVSTLQRKYPLDSDLARLEELLDELHKTNSLVQHRVTDLRKISVKNALKSVPRLVRDVSKKVDKKVALEFVGEELRIDTSIAEILGQGLVHILRNSLDHGLEGPEERRTKGKAETGKITIRSSLRDEVVIVEIQDDGRGVNTVKIRDKIVKNGMFSLEEAKKLSESELQNMIFAPGFSTADAITDISGRGVGLSSVIDSVRTMGGKVLVQSELGQGTVVSLHLPVPKSVLIKSCLFVEIGGHEFAIPQENVLQVIKSESGVNNSKRIQRMKDSEVIEYGGHLIPVLSLGTSLGAQPKEAGKGNQDLLVVSTSKGKLFAIKLDEVRDFEDAVIRTVDLCLKSLRIFSGSTFLGDGKLCLVLDIDGVAEKWISSAETSGRARPPAATSASASSSTNEISYLLFSTSGPQLLAVPQAQLFRIEEMVFDPASQVRRYRDTVIHLIDLDFIENPLNAAQASSSRSSEKRPVLVIQQDQNFYGLVVSNIVDFASTHREIEDLPQQDPAYLGIVVIGEKTATVINPTAVLDMRRNRKENQGAMQKLDPRDIGSKAA